MEQNQNKGWSWLGFFFTASYYAGYGELKKGIVYAVLSGFPPFAIIIAIISGKNANKDLPVGKVKFQWKNVVIAVVITIVSALSTKAAISSLKGVELTKEQIAQLNVCVETSENVYALSRGSIEEIQEQYSQIGGNEMFQRNSTKNSEQLVTSMGNEKIILDTEYTELEQGGCMEVVSAKVESGGVLKEFTKEKNLRAMARTAEIIFKF